MAEEIAWHVELAVKPDQLDNFRVLTGEMVEATRHEPGVLSYQRFVSEQGHAVHLYERYANSAAALAHLRNFAARFGARFLSMVERKRFLVFGDPSRELREELDNLGAIYFKPLGHFDYWA